jgi:hypothetical protein
MAVKKSVATRKKAPVKKAAKPASKKGDTYVCGVCGLAVTVDEACGCMEVHDIICCGKPMKPRKAKMAAAKAATSKKPAAKKAATKKPAAKKKAKAAAKK